MVSSADRVVFLRVAESQELKTLSPSEIAWQQIALKDNKNVSVEAEAKTEKQPSVATENLPAKEEAQEEPREIKLEKAPVDFRYPTKNQTRRCVTRYIEYHRCVAAKGEGALECDKLQKYYLSLCPGEWVDKWNEQRENGTFPGPL